MRLDTDSAWYLRIASSIADGDGPRPPGTPAFPVGYPVLIAALDQVGLGTPWAIVALNLVFLALGLVSLWIVLRLGLGLEERAATAVCALSLLSSYVVKQAAMPLSEIVFFGLVALALALLTVAAARGRPWLLVAGIVVALAAGSVRTAGIALAPAVVLAFRTRRSRVAAAITVTLVATLAVATTPRYLDELSSGWRDGPLRSSGQEAEDLLEILGAAAANVPESRIDRVAPALLVAGAVVLAVVVAVVVARRRRLGPVDGWVLGSLVVLFVWPSDTARFVFPVLPFLLGYGAVLARRFRAAALAYVVLFAAVGLVAIGFSTRLTFAGSSFPEDYADGILAPSYRVAWGLPEPGDAGNVERPVVEMLRRYDPDPP